MLLSVSLFSSGCGAVVKCHPNEMSIALPKALLLGAKREELALLDSNCKPTDNATHFVLTTLLIGCGTLSKHSNTSVVYSNMVRLVPPPTAVITRAPEVKIHFSCHYSKYGVVSTGAITKEQGQATSEAAGHDFTPEDNFCWSNRCDTFKLKLSITLQFDLESEGHKFISLGLLRATLVKQRLSILLQLSYNSGPSSQI